MRLVWVRIRSTPVRPSAYNRSARKSGPRLRLPVSPTSQPLIPAGHRDRHLRCAPAGKGNLVGRNELTIRGNPAKVLEVHGLRIERDQIEHRGSAAALAVAVGARGADRQAAFDLTGAFIMVVPAENDICSGVEKPLVGRLPPRQTHP